MKQRVITALILLAIAVPLIALGGIFTKILMGIVIALGTKEYVENVVEKDNKYFFVLLGLLSIAGIFVIFKPEYDSVFASLMIIILFYLNTIEENLNISKISYLYFMYRVLTIGISCFAVIRQIGFSWVVYILVVTYMADAMALIGGKRFGKHKLNERISPNKTIEGFVIGYLCAAISGIVLGILFKVPSPILMSLIIPAVSQVGDLAFSSIKRYFKIKDFSNIFPGHGGMLDRIDSLIFSLIAFSALLGVVA